MSFYILWATLLVLQNAAFTAVSRARNGGNDWYHALWAVGSNGIWLVATFFTFDKVFVPAGEGLTWAVVGASTLYIGCTVTGSVLMGKLSRRYLERGNRAPGYDASASRLEQLEADVRSMARVLDNHLNSERQRASKAALKQRLQGVLLEKQVETEEEEKS